MTHATASLRVSLGPKDSRALHETLEHRRVNLGDVQWTETKTLFWTVFQIRGDALFLDLLRMAVQD